MTIYYDMRPSFFPRHNVTYGVAVAPFALRWLVAVVALHGERQASPAKAHGVVHASSALLTALPG